MRKIIAILIIVLFCSWAMPSYAQELRLAYINLKKVLDKYEKVTDWEEQLVKQAEKKNTEREKLVKEIKSLR